MVYTASVIISHVFVPYSRWRPSVYFVLYDYTSESGNRTSTAPLTQGKALLASAQRKGSPHWKMPMELTIEILKQSDLKEKKKCVGLPQPSEVWKNRLEFSEFYFYVFFFWKNLIMPSVKPITASFFFLSRAVEEVGSIITILFSKSLNKCCFINIETGPF